MAAAVAAASPTVVSATSGKPPICFFGFVVQCKVSKSNKSNESKVQCKFEETEETTKLQKMQSIASTITSITAKIKLSTCSELQHSKQQFGRSEINNNWNTVKLVGWKQKSRLSKQENEVKKCTSTTTMSIISLKKRLKIQPSASERLVVVVVAVLVTCHGCGDKGGGGC